MARGQDQGPPGQGMGNQGAICFYSSGLLGLLRGIRDVQSSKRHVLPQGNPLLTTVFFLATLGDMEQEQAQGG